MSFFICDGWKGYCTEDDVRVSRKVGLLMKATIGESENMNYVMILLRLCFHAVVIYLGTITVF